MERSENLHSCKIFSKIQEGASQLSLSLCGRKRFELDFISLSIMSSQINSDELRVTRLYGTSNPFFNGTSVSILSLIGRYVYKIRHETLIEYTDSHGCFIRPFIVQILQERAIYVGPLFQCRTMYIVTTYLWAGE